MPKWLSVSAMFDLPSPMMGRRVIMVLTGGQFLRHAAYTLANCLRGMTDMLAAWPPYPWSRLARSMPSLLTRSSATPNRNRSASAQEIGISSLLRRAVWMFTMFGIGLQCG